MLPLSGQNFTKMHGAGNDFVVLDARARALSITAVQARHIADRRRGVGCDQIIILEPDPDADIFAARREADAAIGPGMHLKIELPRNDYIIRKEVAIESSTDIDRTFLHLAEREPTFRATLFIKR